MPWAIGKSASSSSSWPRIAERSLLGRRHNFHHERGRLLAGAERARHLVAERRKALEVRSDGIGVGLRKLGKRLPRHDRHQLAAVGSGTLLQGGDDLLLRPVAQSRVLVRGEIGSVEHPETRDLEADLGAAERAWHVRLAEEVSGR